MIRNITVGIDIGTSMIRVVVAEHTKGEISRIVGTGLAESRGLRHGYITNITEASKAIKRAVSEAEKTSGIKIHRAFVSINGISLSSEAITGVSVVSKGNSEVTELDVQKAIEAAEESLQLANKKIIQTIPLSYKLDGKEVLGKPEGMRGVKLEVKTLFISCLSQHLEDLIVSVAEAGVDVIDVVAAPIAASLITLNHRQKAVGCILANIGAETVSVVVFENNTPISLHVFAIGGTEITKDIALGLKIPLEEAEEIKLGSVGGAHSKKKLDEIIEARLGDIFELIEKHLKKINRNGLLPAGIILTGGGSNLPIIEELAKSSLKIPAKTGSAEYFAATKMKAPDPAWFVALGLSIYEDPMKSVERGSFAEGWQNFKKLFNGALRQLLP